ncbi:Monooxygenase FAD-binding [Penicillium samsonianum]|uniref:Monooxygenase FAD-binding n=1 Tax=Penicillium samsonianum TaxID=1882272 RepID=UPI0025466328|nr:Monooxygenase FAD-binding [Penicillium samsonianum]KAJ6118239.1 Monooxygenase FAD-binding [Penicillium samsonianum]
MTQMKILISGAGVTGNALAFWLTKLGHNVTIVECFPDLRASGLQIDLRGHGVEVMKRMGLEQAFREKSIPEQGMQMVDKSGRIRAYFPANDSSNVKLGFSSDWEIMRGDLCRIMYEITKTRAKYVFGVSIDSFEEEENAVKVQFTDGSTNQFDLVIGADGQGSRTRKLMLGPDAQDPFRPINDTYVGYLIIPWPIKEGEKYIATAYMAPGGRGVMTRRHNDHEIQAYIGARTNSDRLKASLRGDNNERKEALREMLQGAGWQTDEILESLKTADNFYCERIGQVRLDHWSRGRVVLVGDAAYCPSAMTGMGTTSGIVGAYILAGEIGRHCSSAGVDVAVTGAPDSLLAALEAYEQKFHPFITQVQQGVSLDGGRWDGLLSTAFGIAVMNYLLGIASFFRLDRLSRFTSDPAKGWELPEYEELYRN